MLNSIDFKDLLLCGDTHGDFFYIPWNAHENQIENSLYFQVGDFGMGFQPEVDDKANLEHVNKLLVEHNNYLCIIRGNHDNPYYYETNRFNLSNIHFIADYSVLEITLRGMKKRLFCIGGAISVDRKARKVGKSYWKAEGVVFDNDKIKEIKDIDVIISHTSPSTYYPFGFNRIVESFAKYDSELKDDLKMERAKFTALIDELLKQNPNVTHHYYGHFHSSNIGAYKGLITRLLNIGEILIHDI